MDLAPSVFRQQLLGALPRLRRYARSLVYEEASADDLVQGTLERALSRWQQFDQRRDMVVWLLSIAHNAHQDQRRKLSRVQVLDPGVLQAVQDGAGGDAGTDVGLRLDLLAALRRLTPEQCEPLLLVCVEQLSYAEAAEVMGIPVGTVMSRVCRARVALRRFLDGHGAGPGLAPRGLIMDPDFSDEQLSAWLDGELEPAEQRAAVDAWLREHPAEAARVRQWAADRDALRERLAPLLDEPVPEPLRRLVAGAAPRRASGRAPPRRPRCC